MESDTNTLVMMAIQIMAMVAVISVEFNLDGAVQEEQQCQEAYVCN